MEREHKHMSVKVWQRREERKDERGDEMRREEKRRERGVELQEMIVEISGFTDNSHNGRHPEHTEAVEKDGAPQSAKSLLYLQTAGFHI